MEMELQAEADSVVELARLKPLVAARDGRSRTQSIKLVWHDGPGHALLAQGLSLAQISAERRNLWRLERVFPKTQTWLPAQPPPVLLEADAQPLLAEAAPTVLATPLPAPLAPLAAFEGKRTTSLHRFDGAPVTVCVERGLLRSVTTELPVARVLLSGNEHAVRSAALMIAAAVPVSVPRASLAASGIALATAPAGATASTVIASHAPPPRHLGAPVLPDPGMTVSDALAHILGHLTDVILHHAPVAGLPEEKWVPGKWRREQQSGDETEADETPAQDVADKRRVEAVHQMRVAVRRALSALSIFRDALPAGALDQIRTGLKTLGARLGHTRDWDVFVSETAPRITQALPPDERMDRLVAAAVRRQRECRKELAQFLASPEFRLLGIELAWFSAARFWHAQGHLSADLPSDLAAALPEQRAEGFRQAHPETRRTSMENLPWDQLSAESEAERLPDALSLQDFAPGVLQRRWKKLVSAGKRIEELDVPSLHAVRLRAKRARYAAEMFSTLHHGKATHRLIDRLSVLQQRLGVLNDGAVATQLLKELGGASGRHAYATGIVVGFTSAQTEKIRPRIIHAFEKVRHQSLYWS